MASSYLHHACTLALAASCALACACGDDPAAPPPDSDDFDTAGDDPGDDSDGQTGDDDWGDEGDFASDLDDGEEPQPPEGCEFTVPDRHLCAESATCTRDCNKPVCGDGVLSPLAGEECDDALGAGYIGCYDCKSLDNFHLEMGAGSVVVAPDGGFYMVTPHALTRYGNDGQQAGAHRRQARLPRPTRMRRASLR